MMTRPFFIVSSGRSGTAMLHKLLSAKPGVDMHHEYRVEITQPLAVRRYLGLADAAEAQAILRSTYGDAIAQSDAAHWGDSSNKLSWLIPDLAALFPDARFIHLARDGRKVAGSYFHKLADECYGDDANAAMQAHYDGKAEAPPPQKPYWWPVPRRGDSQADAFRRFDQFQRIAWHWAEINRVILRSLHDLAEDRTLFVKLEDLRGSPENVARMLDFLGLPFARADFDAFARPHNVNRPQDRPLTGAQRSQFQALAGPMMTRLGYADTPEYAVTY